MTCDGKLAQRSPVAFFQGLGLAWLGGIALLLSWIYLNAAALDWMARFSRNLSWFGGLFLGAIALLLGQQLYRARDRLQLSFQPQGIPLLLLFGAASASLLLRWHLNLAPLLAICFLVGSYGLLGLWVQSSLWQRGLPYLGAVALVLLLTLQFSTGLGPLARSATAVVVAWILQPLHMESISAENILVLNTGIAAIDLPCSGRKSLWMGSLFLLAASLLDRRRIGLRWFGLCLVNAALLMVANIARILTLVVLIYGLQQQAIADMVHLPLGILSFLSVCTISGYLLRWVPPLPPLAVSADPLPPGSPLRLRPLLWTLGLMVGLTLIPQPPLRLPSLATLPPLQWQAPMQSEAITLTPQEELFFTDYPGVVAEKQSFRFGDLSGSMLLVTSPTWQAHHTPELCLTASGYHLDHMEKHRLSDQVQGRWISLNQGHHSAAYWFQSPQRTTDSYLERIWSEITRRDPKWTMVSILMDQSLSADQPQVQPLVEEVHRAIASRMNVFPPEI
ncbi:exosortase O [Lyngbya confervoides]|uniref:Exosortase O n=1 Tax=Lyngbya confervoides BDU141951 TaxID=1574623 RepID=A0ABD4T5H5_9CYAN|nr:exosortase O [Lyngbya confervoides]MCM1983620.1 exosortase O [Lyngbya confervoides BDU141951]